MRTCVSTVAFLLGAVFAGRCEAAQVAFDSAADPAYDAGWSSGSNGGSGWGGGWVMWAESGTTPAEGHFFTASSTTNGAANRPGDADINTPHTPTGRAWGMTPGGDTGADNALAIRPFAGNLAVGQTVVMDFDPGLMNPAGFAAVALGRANPDSASGATAQLFVTAFPGQANYFVTDRTTPPYGGDTRSPDSGVPVDDAGVRVAITLTGAATYSLTLTPLSTGVPGPTWSGELIFPSDPVNLLVLHDLGGGTAPSQAAFLNNIAIVPEPAACGLAAAAAAALLRRRRRR